MTSDSSDKPAPLRQLIDSFMRQHADGFPDEIKRIFANKTESLVKKGIAAKAVRVGDTAIDFELRDSSGEMVSLRETAAKGPVILNFYRGTWCPYCTFEFQALLEKLPHFRSRGASVLAISPQIKEIFDSPGINAGFVNLPDFGNHVARSYRLVYPLGEEIRKIYEGFGIDLKTLHGDDSYEVPIPATYIIDHELKVRYAHADADFSQRAEPDEVLAEVAKLAA